VTAPELTPRMFGEICEGGCARGYTTVYAVDLPNGVRLWCCRNCAVVKYRVVVRDETSS
jgi:hypothetical protein